VDLATSSLIYMRCSAPASPASWIPRLEAAFSLAERIRVIFDAASPAGAADAASALALVWTERREASAADRPGPGAPR
jgi:hypothetical protein